MSEPEEKDPQKFNTGFSSEKKGFLCVQELKGLENGRTILSLPQEWPCFGFPLNRPFPPVEFDMVLFTFPWPRLGQQGFSPAQNSLTFVRSKT